MNRFLWPVLPGVLLLFATPALAGMPSITLTDVAEARLQNISFFLMGFLACALGVQLLWNYVRRDWTVLPRLSYLRSVALVGLWGLMFVLVLTMISGARELMTPGAWEKKGKTFTLASTPTPEAPDTARRAQLERLRDALVGYAQAHDGRFPPARSDPSISQELWQMPHASGTLYFYQGGVQTKESGSPLAFEPELFGPERLVLFTNGEIRQLGSNEIARLLRKDQP